MSQNPLIELQNYGQSVWYDNIRRALIETGDIQMKIEQDGLRGVTSNPTIFEKAITGSADYNPAMRDLIDQGKSVSEIYEALVIQDIQMAADLFRPVFEQTNGRDGYVSLEVSPRLARDREGTVAEAKRLFARIDRPNVMIKVPATAEGIPAIESLISSGININVTLIFSQETYEKVAEAYIAGLERRERAGAPLNTVASVASFFVSRIDTAIDNALEFRIRRSTDAQESAALQALLGQAAIANAKLAYQRFKEIFGRERFLRLKNQGARVQRPLWASTSAKNPHYRDVTYVEELIGPDTVNTIPPATFTAFRDHGRLRASLEEDVEGARHRLSKLAKTGIDLAEVTKQLQDEGVKSFAESFDTLMAVIEAKRDAILSGILERQSAALGAYQEKVDGALESMEKQQLARRIWRKDPSVWKNEPEHQKIIKNALGWITVTDTMLGQSEELKAFADRVRNDGFQYAMVLGMGGSSLCPDVFRATFGRITGYPKLFVLDSTDPATIRNMERAIKPAQTLFIVSSKSGTTTEVLSFYKYFFAKVKALKGERAGENFIAITDLGTPLETLARAQKFRRVFLNPADIGGRYSALSYFGMVPGALMGIDVKTLIERAERAVHSSASCVPVADNPGARLGASLGELAKAGRDKITFITAPEIQSLGSWIEQLIAESTGKDGQGLLPVDGEPLGDPEVYGNDRVFVSIRLKSSPDEAVESKLKALERAGHPVIRRVLNEALDLGEEFFLWEMATAVTGAQLGINPFDQPNVQESKDNTNQLIDEFRSTGRWPQPQAVISEKQIRLYCAPELHSNLEKLMKNGTSKTLLVEGLRTLLNRARPGDYIALMAYIEPSDAHHALLQTLRMYMRDTLHIATTLGYGPRFLHSTGQFHKGGGDHGIFIQITADDREDIAIPGEPYTFGLLKQAQALGDFRSLSRRKRRVIRFHLTQEIDAGLRELINLAQEAAPIRQSRV
ncbi:MAG: bifunctional transaldolase/phosoglucose isomerase [Acidobacteria bacterium]|nr:bifunctional transaldolase/phosoglucose isomerase [Acidobacteriota bacterium]MBI3658521.1 bifunctional transaldolase/phosoglucose isomerase [Acidobacteriota bacterium]